MNYETKKHLTQNCKTVGMGFWFKTANKHRARARTYHNNAKPNKRYRMYLKALNEMNKELKQ
jgi:hypothetical protein